MHLSARLIDVAYLKIFFWKEINFWAYFISDGILFQNFIELHNKDVFSLLSLKFGQFKFSAIEWRVLYEWFVWWFSIFVLQF